MKIVNLTRQTVLATKVALADSFLKRLVGLIHRKSLPYGEGLILKPCKSVHSFFMNFPIDVVFVNDHFKVVHILEDLHPNRLGPVVRGAAMAIEVPSGVVPWTETQLGDQLSLQGEIV